MRRAIDETYRRRAKQQAYNEAHGIDARRASARRFATSPSASRPWPSTRGDRARATRAAELPKDELYRLIKDLEAQMKEAARALEFERAALLRDQVIELRRTLAVEEPDRIVPREFVQRPAQPDAPPRAAEVAQPRRVDAQDSTSPGPRTCDTRPASVGTYVRPAVG